jgi:1,4-alpha-glucan branching enzyme
MTTDGYLALVLHAHLPFVRHPEYPEFLEEDWLFEAITETYLPLLEVYERLWDDDVDFRITMTLSPPLLSMLNDELLRERYVERLKRLIRLAQRECDRHKDEPHLLYLAEFYLELFERRREQYEVKYGRDLTGAFKKFIERGCLEVMTCGATHGFLPLLQNSPQSVWAQVEVAARYHEECFGMRPQGIWLPECAYFPGLDATLRAAGIRYFIGESHAIEFAVPKPRYGVHAPIYTPSGVAVFARDQNSSV